MVGTLGYHRGISPGWREDKEHNDVAADNRMEVEGKSDACPPEPDFAPDLWVAWEKNSTDGGVVVDSIRHSMVAVDGVACVGDTRISSADDTWHWSQLLIPPPRAR